MGHATFVLIVPLLGALLVGLFGRGASRARSLALVTSFASFLAAVALWAAFDSDRTGYQLVESAAWIPSLGASFLFGVDALGLLFVVLTTLVAPLAILGNWDRIALGARGHYCTLLILEAALFGVFLAIDVLLFYTFLLLSLVCLGLLMSFAGGTNGARVTLRFWTLTMGASLLLLTVFTMCYHIHTIQSGASSFDGRHWVDLVLSPDTEVRLFWASFVALGLLVPLMPMHFWLQGSVQEAPLAGRVFLCAVLVKVGVFGLFRFIIPWFPRAAHTYAPLILTLAMVSVIYGALTLMFESDFARVLARVTAIYMGLAALGLFSFHTDGVKGSIFLMLSHGLFITAWFAWMGMLEKRGWHGQVPELIGLKGSMRWGAGVLTLLSAAAICVPAFGSFVGLFLIARGSLASKISLHALGAGVGLLLMAVVFLKVARKALARKGDRELKDLLGWEVLVLLPMILLVIWMGVRPGVLLRHLDGATDGFISQVAGAMLLTD